MPPTVLLYAATGRCGAAAAHELLERGCTVKAIVRDKARVREALRNNPNFVPIEGSLLDMGSSGIAPHLKDCDAVVCCLGHNLTAKGMCMPPRRLCTDALKITRAAADTLGDDIMRKFVILNTSGCDRPEGETVWRRGGGERCMISCLSCCLPPFADSQAAITYVKRGLDAGKKKFDWCVVRPDDLIDEPYRPYTAFPELQNGLFNAGKTNIGSVGHFMAELVCDDTVWQKWKNQYPQLLNDREELKKV